MFMKRGMNEHGDGELVAQAKEGNLEAFSRLMEKYQEKIYQLVSRFTQNHDDTDDLLQETWMCAFRSLKNFREEARFSTWIYRIAMNLTINFLKRRKKEKEKRDWPKEKSEYDAMPDPRRCSSAEHLSFELREKIQEEVSRLPLPYRSAFTLVVFESMSLRQAAEVLGVAENTVAWRMHKARKMLQKRLEPYLMR